MSNFFCIHFYFLTQQTSLRQPQSLSNPGADFFEISPRPFTLSPPSPSIHSFQYTPRQSQPQLPQQQQRIQSSANNNNNYQSIQRSTTPSSSVAYNKNSQSSVRFPNQPIEPTANTNRFGEQVSEKGKNM